MSRIEVLPYDENWAFLYEKEAEKIKKCLSSNFIITYHIGSTAVKGLCAKPKIDVIIVAKNIILATQQLISLSYKAKGEVNIPFHQYMRKNLNNYGFNLHIYEEGNAEIKLNLMFRDFLRENSDFRNRYAKLKLFLVEQKAFHLKNKNGFTGYNLGKNQFIVETIKKTGFNELCLRYCIHHKEWEEYHRIIDEQLFKSKKILYKYTNEMLTDKNNFYFVLYKGVNIVSVACVNSKNDNLKIKYIASDNKEIEYLCKIKNLLKIWITNRQF